MKRLRVFGLQRSGTTYFEYLMRENYFVDILGRINTEKHSHSERVFIDTPCVLVVRHPLTWAVSYSRFARHFTWHVEGRPFREWLPTYADIWNSMMEDWVHCTQAFVRHEDLLARPQEVVRPIAASLGLERRSVGFVRTHMHIHIRPLPSDVAFDYREADIRERIKYYPGDSASEFMEKLDQGKLKHFGYGRDYYDY